MSRTWTKEKVDLLLSLKGKHTKAVIAEKLGVTRNAVIGKLARINSGAKPVCRVHTHRRKPRPVIEMLEPIIEKSYRPLKDLRPTDCREPTCGARVVAKGQSYCEHHYNLYYVKDWRHEK